MFLMNARRSGSSEDTDRARKYLDQMTEQEPSEYRGWLGLALCACLHRPESSEGALRQLREGAKYYSYVVAAGADNIASQEYTEAKSRLWEEILKVYRRDAARYTGADEVKRLREQAAQLGSFFGHTQPHLRGDYERLLAEIDERVRAAEAERLRLEKEAEIKAIAEQCEWEDDSHGGSSLKKYNGNSSRVIIPETVGGRKVTRIGIGAFKNCTSLTSITIPDSVTEIGVLAFSSCTGLTSITIPDSVTHIGDGAFMGCTGLTSVIIPDGVTEIGGGAFRECTSLTSVIIPDGVTHIDDGAFMGCTGLTSVTIPGKVERFGREVFKGCPNLTVYGTGGFFSKVRKAARKSRVKYKKIK